MRSTWCLFEGHAIKPAFSRRFTAASLGPSIKTYRLHDSLDYSTDPVHLTWQA